LVGAAGVVGHPVELVIFDCDGVLIDSEVISTRSTVKALGALGYEISEADAFQQFVGKSYSSMRRMIEADWGRAPPDSFSVDLERLTLKTMADDLQPVPGVATALARIDLPRCVASSSSMAWIRQGLASTSLLAFFDPHLFSANMVENGKPAPDVFLHAARQMGVPPERAVVVEDSIAGVTAGAAAGMTVIGFTGGSHIVDPDHGDKLRAVGAGHVVEVMDALPDLLLLPD
jgi:HAD superfamily hydrolase (TIGR01509 family)